MVSAAQVLEVGRQEVGYVEHPTDSNDTKYGQWYGLNGEPWCAMFQSWVLHQAGVSNFAIQSNKGFSWTVAGVNWFKSHGMWIPSASAVPGDLIFYDWGGNGVADHVGMLVGNGNTMQVLEGNTGDVSQQNGGAVMIRSRDHGSHCLGAGRMAHFYTGSTSPKPHVSWEYDNGSYGHPQIQRGWSGHEVVNHLQGKLLTRGINIVTDGVFGPNTQAAVKKFQGYHHLTQDGVVGLHTWTALHT